MSYVWVITIKCTASEAAVANGFDPTGTNALEVCDHIVAKAEEFDGNEFEENGPHIDLEVVKMTSPERPRILTALGYNKKQIADLMAKTRASTIPSHAESERVEDIRKKLSVSRGASGRVSHKGEPTKFIVTRNYNESARSGLAWVLDTDDRTDEFGKPYNHFLDEANTRGKLLDDVAKRIARAIAKAERDNGLLRRIAGAKP